MGTLKLSPEEKVRLSDEIKDRLTPCLYLSTNWSAVTGAIFFGVPTVALLALSSAGHPSDGVPERLGLFALIAEGVVYWLCRRSYYKAFNKEWESETWVPDTPAPQEPLSEGKVS